jgi:hypothetical protein
MLCVRNKHFVPPIINKECTMLTHNDRRITIAMSSSTTSKWLTERIQDESIRFYSRDQLSDIQYIGHGGYGVVFKARIEISGIVVAYKLIDSKHYQDDEALLEDFVKKVGCLMNNIMQSLYYCLCD